MEQNTTDVVIIGAGPVGLFAVFECGMLGLHCHVIDGLDLIGGQCSVLYPDKPIYDIPAHPVISGFDLIKQLKAQIEPFNPLFHLGSPVENITKCGERWRIINSNGDEITAKSIIIAAGVGAFAPRKIPIQGLEEYENKSIFYWVKDKRIFADKKVVVFGGGDSALDWAISLADICSHVTLIHRRDKFRAMQSSIDRIESLVKDGRIDKITGFQIYEVAGQDGHLNEVIIADLDGNKTSIKADCILAFFGLSQNLGPIANWGLDLNKKQLMVDPATMSTSIPGIFAVGDIAAYPHKLKLILSGFAEAAAAAHKIRDICFPDQAFHFEYSTTSGINTIKG